MARLGAELSSFRERGADLVAVGNGTALMAQDFVETFSVPFPVYTDPDRAAYRLSGLRRGFGLGLKTLGYGKRAATSGHVQGKVQGDPWQQGGALVISPEPRLLYHFVSDGAGHHVSLGELLSVLDGD